MDTSTPMTYEHDYCSIFRQQSNDISNQEHPSDYDTAVNEFNLSKVNEVLGIASEKFDGKAPSKVHMGYACCVCEYEHTKRYTVERHMGQIHGVGRFADLRVKYEEKKIKNKEQRKMKRMERFSAEIGLPSLLAKSQQVKVQLDVKKVELDNIIKENKGLQTEMNGLKQKLHEREKNLTQTVNDRGDILSQLEVTNSTLHNKVEELKSQLLQKCNENSDASRMFKEKIFEIQLRVQQLNGRIKIENKNALATNNALAHEKCKTKTMLDSMRKNEHNILELRAENLSIQKKVDICGREKKNFNLEANDMRATIKTYGERINEVQLENELLRDKMVKLKSKTECERNWQMNKKNLEDKIKQYEGIANILKDMLKKNVDDSVRFVIPKGLMKLKTFDSNHIYWIFDTNVLLGNIDYIVSVTLLPDNDKLILPRVVTEELEYIKTKQHQDSSLQFKCRKVVRVLHNMAVLVKDKLFCAALDTTKMGSSTTANDEKLRKFAKKLSKRAKVCFVTHDKTLGLMTFPDRCETFIPASIMCDEYRNFNL